MSALFHPYLCGRIAAEWLIKMKKSFALKNLDCANCAAKMEEAIRHIQGVKSVTVSFLMQKVTLEADEGQLQSIIDEMVRVCKKIEPDCTVCIK